MKTKIFHSPAQYDHLHSRWSPSSPSLLKEAEDSFLKPLNLQSEGEVKEQWTWTVVVSPSEVSRLGLCIILGASKKSSGECSSR